MGYISGTKLLPAYKQDTRELRPDEDAVNYWRAQDYNSVRNAVQELLEYARDGGSGVSIQDDGTPVDTATTLNLGANLTVSVVGGVATIDASGGSGAYSQDPTYFYIAPTLDSGNTISGLYSVILGGTNNTISTPNIVFGAAILSGDTNTVTHSGSVIAGGVQNSILAERAFLGSGYLNSIGSSYGFMGGGESNLINSGTHSVICGGYANQVTAQCSVIGGGQNNTVSNTNSAICGGQQNASSADSTFIGGGYSNTCLGTASVVVGGETNEAGGVDAFIGGGISNVTSASYTTISGGGYNEATADYSSVPGGLEAITIYKGQVAHASGGHPIDDADPSGPRKAGTAQAFEMTVRGRTTAGSNTTILSTDGIGDLNYMPDRAAWILNVQVIGREYNGTGTAAYSIDVVAADLTIKSLMKNTLFESDPACDADVIFTPGVNAFAVQVTGDAANTFYWVATIRATQVITPEVPA